jgi:hypothetical protein
MQNPLKHYIDLIDAFLKQTVSESEFEKAFLATYKADKTMWKERAFAILDSLFGDVDVDAFCSDANLRESNDLSGIQLWERVALARAKLEKLDAADVAG